MDPYHFELFDNEFIDHVNSAHPPTPVPHITQYFMNEAADTHKNLKNGTEDFPDLALHTAQMFSTNEERQNGDSNSHISHLVASPIENWNQYFQNQQKIFHQNNNSYMNSQHQNQYSETGPFSISNPTPLTVYPIQSHQMPTQEYIANNGPNTKEPFVQSPKLSYGGFDHLPPQTNRSLNSRSQVPSTSTQAAGSATKSDSRKSNKARKQKYYDYCITCDKGFKSSAYIKKHYNTTKHKNAVKFSGQPYPATLPKSPHHHLPCDSTTATDRSSNTPSEDSRDDTYTLPIQPEHHSAFPGLLPQSLSGTYHSQWLSNGAVGTNPDINMSAPMMPMKNYQFQMYPIDPASVATQYMATNSLNTTSALQFTNGNPAEARPLPSFEEIKAHRHSLL